MRSDRVLTRSHAEKRRRTETQRIQGGDGMKLFASKRSHDPAHVRDVMNQLGRALAQTLGDDLESLIMYGDFVKGKGFKPSEGIVNVLLVLRQISCQQLDRIRPAMAEAEKQISLASMTVTHEDIVSSCDVFPIKFHDMQRHHRLIVGRDVLSDLVISDDHLRLRCEQQLKNLMIRLRSTYLHRSQRDSDLLDTLCEAANHFLRDVQACLFVKTGVVPEDESDMAESFAKEFGIDASVMSDMLALRDRGSVPEGKDLREIFDRFMKLVHDAAIAVDQMESCS
ncbi:MAG: hypothetical protein ACR2NZ_16980 [Rubripirellula sp.]